ncbi:hypothetical protein [Candidatus Palauibacter sp.]|uniref:hypothetical protein n=1 Tax=Candidatus Palauibacter sp. TaxID=3101350 RepID=UPI003C6EBEA0
MEPPPSASGPTPPAPRPPGQTPDDQTLPPLGAPVFRATVHGLAFEDRARHLDTVSPREELLLIPDPPGGQPDDVWVHVPAGDPVGHLPREIGAWLAPWMRRGGSARVQVLKVGPESEPSWRRLLVEVRCGG